MNLYKSGAVVFVTLVVFAVSSGSAVPFSAYNGSVAFAITAVGSITKGSVAFADANGSVVLASYSAVELSATAVELTAPVSVTLNGIPYAGVVR